jgi:exosortase O
MINRLKRNSFIGKPAALLTNAALIALWLALYRAVYPYLGVIFTRQEFRTNQIVLLGALFLIALQIRKGELRLNLTALPQLYPLALIFALGGSMLYLLIERFLDINTFSATLFGLASYGLLGLWMRPRYWRQGLPAALLLVGALPFGEHLQTFVGYPVRILTAAIVRDGFAALGIHTVGIDTILVFENGISKVDLPCSGVKSLWTGGLFLLAATWIERRPINLRWPLVALAFSFSLLAANLIRVAILVAIGEVTGWRLAAEMLHIPLGVLGFVAACATAVGLLHWTTTAGGKHEPQPTLQSSNLSRPPWLAPSLGGVVLVMALLYTPRAGVALAQSPPAWQFPTDMQVEPWSLTPREQEWLAQGGVQGADRWRFQFRDLSGSMLFVSSTTWRAHHRPERCFEVYGLSVDGSYTYLVSPDFPVRVLSLGSAGEHNLMSAAYWLQSAEQSTDDYATRIWADLEPQRQRWVLITVLYDTALDPRSPESQDLFETLRLVVQRNLEGGL